MLKKQLAAASFIGFLLLAGVGCGGAGGSGDSNESLGTTIKKELRGTGDKNASLSKTEKDKVLADAKKVVEEVFGSGAKISAQQNSDLIVKQGFDLMFTLPSAISGNPQSKAERAFKSAGYSILDGEGPGESPESENFGGLVVEKKNTVIYFIYEVGEKQVSFMTMSSDQYAFVENSAVEE